MMNKIQIAGRVSSLSLSPSADHLLVTTILNGSHVFSHCDQLNEKDDPTKDDREMSSSIHDSCAAPSPSSSQNYNVETYSSDNILASEPFLSGCFVKESGEYIAVGSSTGQLVTVCRRSRAKISSYQQIDGGTIRSLSAMKGDDTSVLLCTDSVTEIVDIEIGSCREQLKNLAPRAVGALSLDRQTVAVANYDGKVLLFDLRHSAKPECILSIPDQICSFTICPRKATVCAGTVGGRVFTLRCLENTTIREEAFTTGTTRSPIRSLAVNGDMVAAGDVSGRLSLISISPSGTSIPTAHWTAKSLFPPSSLEVQSDAECFCDSETGNEEDVGRTSARINWDNAEVTGVAIAGESLWASFCVHGTDFSNLISLPITHYH